MQLEVATCEEDDQQEETLKEVKTTTQRTEGIEVYWRDGGDDKRRWMMDKDAD